MSHCSRNNLAFCHQHLLMIDNYSELSSRKLSLGLYEINIADAATAGRNHVFLFVNVEILPNISIFDDLIRIEPFIQRLQLLFSHFEHGNNV